MNSEKVKTEEKPEETPPERVVEEKLKMKNSNTAADAEPVLYEARKLKSKKVETLACNCCFDKIFIVYNI